VSVIFLYDVARSIHLFLIKILLRLRVINLTYMSLMNEDRMEQINKVSVFIDFIYIGCIF